MKQRLTGVFVTPEKMTVNGQRVQVIDRFRLWPNWWEGEAPRDYYLIDFGGRTLLLYQTFEGWFYAKTLD